MKKLYFLLLFAGFGLQAQIVDIPDANFKYALTSAGPLFGVAYNDLGAHIAVDTNGDGEIQAAEALLVTRLDLYERAISDLTGIAAFANLKDLGCNQNQLTSLEVSALTQLTRLNCSGNQLTSLDVSQLTQLINLACGENPISSLDVSMLNLERLFVDGTLLSTIDVGMLTNLQYLACGGPNFTGVDISNLHNLISIGVVGSTQTEFDVSHLPLLENFALEYSNVVSIDLSQNPLMDEFFLDHNDALAFINLKNGQQHNYPPSDCPNLQYICADEFNFPGMQLASDPMYMNNPNVQVGSYCSFTPGGLYNTISGKVRIDLDGNGCSSADPYSNSVKIHVNDGGTDSVHLTRNTGSYAHFVQNTNVTLTPEIENPSYFNISPASVPVNFAAIDGSSQVQDFCVTANGVHPDVEVVIAPITPARPGFSAAYTVIVKNKGNQTASGDLILSYNEDLLDLQTVFPAATSTAGQLLWNYSGLNPFSDKVFNISFLVNAPVDTPAVNIGDVLSFSANAALTADETPEDNSFTFNQVVVGSYDPNDKYCLEGSVAPVEKIGDYLHYCIRFENTGTFAAENIVIRDDIDPNFYDISSFQLIRSSHLCQTRINGNRIEFIHEGIDLLPSGGGFVIFKIKTKSTLFENDVVTNKANIYFDFNFPVETNTAATSFETLGLGNYAGVRAAIYPNPATNLVNVKCDDAIKSITLYDLQGRIVAKQVFDADEVTMDISSLSNGVYAIETATDSGRKIEKLVKK